jgi:hypothetical protein
VTHRGGIHHVFAALQLQVALQVIALVLLLVGRHTGPDAAVWSADEMRVMRGGVGDAPRCVQQVLQVETMAGWRSCGSSGLPSSTQHSRQWAQRVHGAQGAAQFNIILPCACALNSNTLLNHSTQPSCPTRSGFEQCSPEA